MTPDLPQLPGAKCADHPRPDLWFPRTGASRAEIAEPVAICNTCPARDACAAYALADRQQYPVIGIWGGLTFADRARLRANRKADADLFHRLRREVAV